MNELSVTDFIASLDERSAQDSEGLITMMRHVSGHEPQMWGPGTVGFDSYHYKYDSGREGDSHVIGFRPGKGKITIYLMDGTARYTELLGRLGKHKTSQVCLYINHLSDVDASVLTQVMQESYDYVKSQDASRDRANG